MPDYTLKVVKIECEGSIGRQLKATVTAGSETKSFGFEGTSSSHRIIAKNIIFPLESVQVPVKIEVTEEDPQASDKPFSATRTLAIDTSGMGPAEIVVAIAEVGGKGASKGKKASVRFTFVAAVPFSVRAIPGIMIANGMTTAPTLMNRWFAAPAGRQTPNTTVVKMDWVLSFDRARKVYEKIITDKVLLTPAAVAVIRKKYGKTVGAFGDFTLPVMDLHMEQVQFQQFSASETDDLDDLFCALGNFSFFVAIKGSATAAAINITHIAVYVRDDYEFDDKGFVQKKIMSQVLGYWNHKTLKVSKLPGPDFSYVSNSDFRSYRKGTGTGGDFLIFSDIRVIKLAEPVSIKKK